MSKPGKVALLSDIHGNSPALRAVLEDVVHQGCTRVFVLGDIVNGIDPHGCLELIKTMGNVECIKGNAEFYVLTPDLHLFPKRHEPMYIQLIQLIQWFQTHLSNDDLAWLRQLPDFLIWDGACLVHDSPFDRFFPHEWRTPGIDPKYQEFIHHSKGISPNMTDDEFAKLLVWMEAQDLSKVFCGHTHVPFCQQVGTEFICNTGSVGMPLDGDPRPSWVMLEETPDGVNAVIIRRVTYDMEQILSLIDHTPDYPDFDQPGARQAYKMTLQTGIFRGADPIGAIT